MKVGFTGTRHGMTDAQRIMVTALLDVLRTAHGATRFHHGDCVGADQEADSLATNAGLLVTVHPPDDDRLRAFCGHADMREPKPYHDRNEDIIREADVMIACPSEDSEQPRGGTWFTYRKALTMGRTVWLISPSGLPVRCDP